MRMCVDQVVVVIIAVRQKLCSLDIIPASLRRRQNFVGSAATPGVRFTPAGFGLPGQNEYPYASINIFRGNKM